MSDLVLRINGLIRIERTTEEGFLSMKIRMIPENKVYAGTPADVVSKLSADAIFLKHKTPEEYLRAVSRRLPSIKVEGKTFEDRCESFLCGMLANGMAKVVLQEACIDQYEIRIMRMTLGISQEKLANRLGVSFATVNRWEKGLHTPRSGAIITNLRRTAGELIASRQSQFKLEPKSVKAATGSR
jgi:DNA-binding XRE family transcriptional regulator